MLCDVFVKNLLQMQPLARPQNLSRESNEQKALRTRQKRFVGSVSAIAFMSVLYSLSENRAAFEGGVRSVLS